MTSYDPNHTPTPEFRASLEQQVIDVYREETRAARPRRFLRFRTPMTLAAGLVLGMTTQLAVGQVQRGKERSELEVAIDAKRMVAITRLELARAIYEQAKKSFDVGATSRSALLTAEAELRAQETSVYSLQLDLLEVRETAMAPRDDLWAPLVGGRDFVKDHLNAEASAMQRKLESVEAAAAEAERSYRAGTTSKAALDDAQGSVEQVKAQLETLAYRLTLRRQVLDEHLTPQITMQRLKRFQTSHDLQRADQELKTLQEYYEAARTRAAAGADDNIEVLRLRVKVLEMQSQIVFLRERLQELSVKRPE